MLKRSFDVAAAGIGLVLLSPLLAIIAILIKRGSDGPAIYRQHRVGLAGNTFRIHKFRTMYANRTDAGPSITTGDDERITALGLRLRKLKLDELPQLVDVLAGDMSIVGPRPEVPRYVSAWPPDKRALILSVRPGITDPAAIEFIDEATELSQHVDHERAYLEIILPRKLALYEQYVLNRTLFGDVKIIAKTVRALFART